MYYNLERIRKSVPPPEELPFRPSSARMVVSCRQEVAHYVSSLVEYVGVDAAVIPYTYGQNVRSTVLRLYNMGATLILADHDDMLYAAMQQFLADHLDWPATYINTGYTLKPTDQPDLRTIHSAATAEHMSTFLAELLLKPNVAEQLFVNSAFPLTKGRTKETLFDRVLVVGDSAVSGTMVQMLYSRLAGNRVDVLASYVSSFDAMPDHLHEMLIDNPVTADNYQQQTRTLFILMYSGQAEYESLLRTFGSDPRYGLNYYLLVGSSSVLYWPTVSFGVQHTFPYALLLFQNMSSIGHKLFNRLTASSPMSSAAFALGDLLQDLYCGNATVSGLMNRAYVEDNPQRIYFRKNLYLLGHQLLSNGTVMYPHYVYQSSYNPTTIGYIPSSAAPKPVPL